MIGYRKPNNINDNILILDEPYDICIRKVLCMRGSNEDKIYRAKILEGVRNKLKDINTSVILFNDFVATGANANACAWKAYAE